MIGTGLAFVIGIAIAIGLSGRANGNAMAMIEFGGGRMASSAELESARGGFLLPGDRLLRFGVEMLTLIDGDRVAHFDYQSDLAAGLSSVQPFAGGALSSVITNNQDQRLIQRLTAVSIEFDGRQPATNGWIARSLGSLTQLR